MQGPHFELMMLSNKCIFPGGSDGKEYACNAGDPDSIPGEGNGNPIQSILLPGEVHGQRSWQATVHGVAKSQTPLSD